MKLAMIIDKGSIAFVKINIIFISRKSYYDILPQTLSRIPFTEKTVKVTYYKGNSIK